MLETRRNIFRKEAGVDTSAARCLMGSSSGVWCLQLPPLSIRQAPAPGTLQPQVTLMCSTADTGEPTGKCVHPLAAARVEREPVWQNRLREFCIPNASSVPVLAPCECWNSWISKEKTNRVIFEVCPEKGLCISHCSLNYNWLRRGQAASSQNEPVSRLWQIHDVYFLQLKFISSLSGLDNFTQLLRFPSVINAQLPWYVKYEQKTSIFIHETF